MDHHDRSGRTGQWCWAAEAADALRTMKHLVDASLACNGTLNGVDPARMLQATHAFRPAARLGMKATSARNLEKDTTPSPAACWSGTMTTCGSLWTRGFRPAKRGRTRITDGQDPAEGLRLPAHPGRG